jgi:hypothetical protein
MTRQEAKELLPIIKAFAEGKTIQIKQHPQERWEDATAISFMLHCSCYRIRPEPREFIIQVYSNQKDPLTLHLISPLPPGDYTKPIKVREVIE